MDTSSRPLPVLIRGGGDLASGVTLRLHRAGLQLVMTELAKPLAVRRLVSFGEAVYTGEMTVEGVTATLAKDVVHARRIQTLEKIPILIDPRGECRTSLMPVVIVDARMTKQPPDLGLDSAPLVIGLGPGFFAGRNCHAVIETKRGHTLGRVIWQGMAEPDTGIPEVVENQQTQRVLRAPADGVLRAFADIGDQVSPGQALLEVNGHTLNAPFPGVLRGMLHPGLEVHRGMKVGDLDPRNEPTYSRLVSDKSLAVGGGVLEAILTRPDVRSMLWT